MSYSSVTFDCDLPCREVAHDGNDVTILVVLHLDVMRAREDSICPEYVALSKKRACHITDSFRDLWFAFVH